MAYQVPVDQVPVFCVLRLLDNVLYLLPALTLLVWYLMWMFVLVKQKEPMTLSNAKLVKRMDAQCVVVVLQSNALLPPVSSATMEPVVMPQNAHIHLEYNPTKEPVNVEHILTAQHELACSAMPPTIVVVVHQDK